MTVRLRLMRVGKMNRPAYRICAVEKRRQRDGAYLDRIGFYDPFAKDKQVKIDKERAEYWLSVGAQPSATVLSFLRREKVAGLIRSVSKAKRRKKPASVARRRAARRATDSYKKRTAQNKAASAKKAAAASAADAPS